MEDQKKALPVRYEWEEGRAMAYALIKAHPEVFKLVPPLQDILFVMDTADAPKSKGRRVCARVSKITGRYIDFIDAGEKSWMLEWFRWNTEHMTINQRYVLMAHELLHFDCVDGEHKLRGHDVEEFHLIANCFGLRWGEEIHGDVPDILAPDFKWGVEGQAVLDFTNKDPRPPADSAQAENPEKLAGGKVIPLARPGELH